MCYHIAPAAPLPGCLLQSVVWSLGVLAHLLMLGRLPFTPSASSSPSSAAAEAPGSSNQDIPSLLLADMGSRCRRGFKFPLWLSDGAKDFITAALAFDPVKRLSLGAALDHPWVLALSFTPANAVDRWVVGVGGWVGGWVAAIGIKWCWLRRVVCHHSPVR
jgi:serine/threonine protein kinase